MVPYQKRELRFYIARSAKDGYNLPPRAALLRVKKSPPLYTTDVDSSRHDKRSRPLRAPDTV